MPSTPKAPHSDTPPPQVENAGTVLHVITRLVAGGAARVVLDQCRLLNENGWHVHLASGLQTGSEGSYWPEARAMAERGHLTLHEIPSLVREMAPHKDALALAATKRLIARLKPTIVHAHTSKGGLIGTMAARKMVRTPGIVLTPHGHIFNREARIPGVPSRGVKRWLMERFAALSTKAAHIVTCPNQAELDEGLRVGVWTRAKARVVANGIDIDLYQPRDRDHARQALGLPQTNRIIGVVARLTQEKGVDLAIEALAMLDSFDMAICGDGPERESLEQLASALGVNSRIHWLGRVVDMASAYPAFDMLMVPSRTEAHGLVAAEAMACGIPVVATRVGGLQSVLSEGRTGTFAIPDEPKSLAAGAMWIASQSPTQFSSCREWVVSRWSHPAMISDLLAAYREARRGK